MMMFSENPFDTLSPVCYNSKILFSGISGGKQDDWKSIQSKLRGGVKRDVVALFMSDKFRTGILATMILAVFAGCSASSDGSDNSGQNQWNPYDKYYQILLNETELTLNVGETYQLSVEIRPERNDDIFVYYNSDDDRVASVSESGLVSAKSFGSTRICVGSEKDRDDSCCYITVNDPYMLTPENAAEILGEDYKYKTTIVIPEGVTGIGSYVLASSYYVENIVIPSTVTYIAGRAFEWCGNLKSIVIPSSVTAIGDWAFYGCENLQDVYIDNIESYNKIEFGNGWSSEYSRPDCYGATLHIIDESFEIPSNDIVVLTQNNVYKILTDDYYSRGYVEIPETVKQIGDQAFLYRYDIRSISFPDGIVSIGNGAFCDSSKIDTVSIKCLESWLGINFADCLANPLFYARYLYVNDEKLTDLVIPDGTTKINDYAFCNYKSLQNITISRDVISIGEEAFCLCDNLQSVKIPEGLTSIGRNAFLECNNIKTVYVETHETWRNLDFGEGNYTLKNANIVFMDEGEVNITVKFPNAEKGDVQNLEWSKNENIVTISAESGHSSYAWFVDMQKQSTAKSALEFDTTNKKAGLYSVMVVIDGKYSATATIEVLK